MHATNVRRNYLQWVVVSCRPGFSFNYLPVYTEVHSGTHIINRLIQAKCVALVSNCCLGLETAMAPTLIGDGNVSLMVNTGNLSENNFDCVCPKDLTQYISSYNPMTERRMTQLNLRYSSCSLCIFSMDFNGLNKIFSN